MKVEIKKIDKLKRNIKIEIKGDEFLSQKKETYEESSKKLKVPGFRPGSAPLDILEKHHGKILKEELLRKSVPFFYQKALEENKLSPAGLPKIYDVDLSADYLVFSAEFEARPEIDIKEDIYKGIKIKDSAADVKKEEIEKVITNIKEGIKKVLGKDYSDDDIAKWASYPDVDSFRQAIQVQLSLEKIKQRRQAIDTQIRQHLLKSFKSELPKAEIERHHKELVDREIHNLRMRGVSSEDLDKYKKDIEEKTKNLAFDEVKLFYVLEAIAKNEGIKVDNNFADVVLGFILSKAQYNK